jgi:CheY-like chemotaxis protein
MPRIVLIAEDDPISQRMAAAVVESCGYRAHIVQHGAQCLETLQKGLQPDLLLLDLEMPVMDGIQVLRAMKQAGGVEICPIVVFTSHHNEQIVLEAIKLGADDFIVKPFHPHELGQRISDLIFEIDDAQLRLLIEKLHFQDPALADQPSIKQQVGQSFNLYPVMHDHRSICVAIPQGLSPQSFARMSLPEIVMKIMIFRKCSTGWRKVWPRAHTLSVLRPSSKRQAP